MSSEKIESFSPEKGELVVDKEARKIAILKQSISSLECTKGNLPSVSELMNFMLDRLVDRDDEITKLNCQLSKLYFATKSHIEPVVEALARIQDDR